MTENATRVWFCSADSGFVQLISRMFGPGHEIHHTGSYSLDSEELNDDRWDAILIDFRSTEDDASRSEAFALLDKLNSFLLPPPIIAMVENEERALTLQLMEHGTYDTITSPPDIVELRLLIRRARKFRQTNRELYELRTQEKSKGHFQELIGAAENMQAVFSLARKIAPCDVSVLVTGETGTGKELLARAVHRLSAREGNPYVAFSCASLPETLLEDELFGHEKGAFTGALVTRRGRFESADQGTLFLDEIGDLGLGLQSKLLRVLQERTFERLGSNTTRHVNIRLICATHRNLIEMVERGEFREDLYYRLNVVQIHIPSLRERSDDIPLLAHHFLGKFSQEFGKKIRGFSRQAMHALEEHAWPGNVRELENTIQRAIVIAEGPTVEVWHLPAKFRNGFEKTEQSRSYEVEVRDFKRRLIMRTLDECGWHKAETARTLGMARNYLHRLINQLQIQNNKDAVAAAENFTIPNEANQAN